MPEDRHVLLEGTEAGALADCASPEIGILTMNAGGASLFPTPAIGRKADWSEGNVLGPGDSTSQTLTLPRGASNLSLQYFAPFELTLSAPGFRMPLKPALDGQRPNTISLANDGQFWPAGRVSGDGRPVRFTITTAAEPTTLQRLSGYDGKAYVGELIAVPDKPHKLVLLPAACGSWIDWYESSEAPRAKHPRPWGALAFLIAIATGLGRSISERAPWATTRPRSGSYQIAAARTGRPAAIVSAEGAQPVEPGPRPERRQGEAGGPIRIGVGIEHGTIPRDYRKGSAEIRGFHGEAVGLPETGPCRLRAIHRAIEVGSSGRILHCRSSRCTRDGGTAHRPRFKRLAP